MATDDGDTKEMGGFTLPCATLTPGAAIAIITPGVGTILDVGAPAVIEAGRDGADACRSEVLADEGTGLRAVDGARGLAPRSVSHVRVGDCAIYISCGALAPSAT